MRSDNDQPPPIVVMMCGVAGSGKTTHARGLEAEGYIRLSIDEEIWRRYGAGDIDCDAAEYERRQAEAENALLDRLRSLLARRRNVVLDYSFHSRARREYYRRIIEEAGARRRLVYLEVDPETLSERLRRRDGESGPNSVVVAPGLLARYLLDFEVPVDEGQTTIRSGATPPTPE
ncbi:AAA family ATPase [Nocardia arizonensis]|uniref:AAA family ATPase n=1 Tax=Nocardia arizonensis TaxID=1141647 RepID=UPI00138EDE93|nr:ATP-binding protein [Nocardia arizonensis]